jgi:hypothetical protein
MKLTLTLIILISLAGCSFKPLYPMDDTDKFLLTTAIGTVATDVYTTDRALDNPDNYEANSFAYGHDPSTERLIWTGCGRILLMGVIAYTMPPKARKCTLGFFTVLQGGVSLSNWDKK